MESNSILSDEMYRDTNSKTCSNQSTPKNNKEILPEEIFGVVVYQCQLPRFQVNGSKIISIATEVYKNYIPDVMYLEQLLIKEELAYYATALFWLRCIDIKFKQQQRALTFAEDSIREVTFAVKFNVPKSLYVYLSQMGSVEKMGIKAEFNVPPLPTAQVGGLGGYHAEVINDENHYMFEELPCLGIAADMIMAAASTEDEPVPNFHIRHPVGSRITHNLCGNIAPIGQHTSIRQKLSGWGISESKFPEYEPNTRFDLKYLCSISDTIGKFNTFHNKNVCFRKLSVSGSVCQLIKTVPVQNEDLRCSWNDRMVVAMANDSMEAIVDIHRLAQMSVVFGFQLFKEGGAGADVAARMANWSCLRPEGEEPWILSKEWVENRNICRNFPECGGSTQFHINCRQDEMLTDFVRAMIVTKH